MVDGAIRLGGMLIAASARDGTTNSSVKVPCHAAADAKQVRKIADSCPATQQA
jgi:hypothetical protein